MDFSRFLAKRADAAGESFAGAVQQMAAGQLRHDALGDVGNMALLGLGTGAAGRGLVGLINMLRTKPKKTRSGPVTVSLPYPVKTANFLAGDAASTKSGIPWYGPAMLGAGLGSMALGWKGLDHVLNKRRESERQRQMEMAESEFQDALLAQHPRPIAAHPDLAKPVKHAADGAMAEAGRRLDGLFDRVEKQALDAANLGGQAVGGYGMYAGLSGLLAGAYVYNQMNKRSRRSVLDKALAKRERRKFMQSPTEIYAVPHPVQAGPEPAAIEG